MDHDHGIDVISSLADLLRVPLTLPENALCQRALELAQVLTSSSIAYAHYVNEDQESLELGTWSGSTIRECQVVGDRHYPLAAAGVWADTFRRRAPQMHNDYDALGRDGMLPPGHITVIRHLGVPVIEDGVVRMLVGVGNKPTPYDADDVAVLQQVADDTWLMLERIRERTTAQRDLAQLRAQSDLAQHGTWEWDPEARLITMGPLTRAIIGDATGQGRSGDGRTLMAALRPEDAARVRSALADPGREPFDLTVRAAEGIRATRLRIRGHWEPRTHGDGFVAVGTIQDESVLETLEEHRFRATHDPLTGLLNRSSLLDRLADVADRRRAPQEEYALMFVDLDDFKAVNDTYGHLMGDRVLEEAARRLRAATRDDDVIARYGGDEFVILAAGVRTPQEAEILGRRVVAAMASPVVVEGLTCQVGASVGAALTVDTLPGIDALLRRADRALYLAKEQRSGLVVAGLAPHGPVEGLPGTGGADAAGEPAPETLTPPVD